MRRRMIEALMCDFRINAAEIRSEFGISKAALAALLKQAHDAFGGVLSLGAEGLFIPPEARPLTRMIARHFDAYDLSKAGHSAAI